MQNLTFPFLEFCTIIEVMASKCVKLYIFYCSFSIFCSNSNSVRQIVEKGGLYPIREKKNGTLPSYLLSNARLVSGTS